VGIQTKLLTNPSLNVQNTAPIHGTLFAEGCSYRECYRLPPVTRLPAMQWVQPKKTDEETDMPAVFELKSNDDGQYIFHFINGKGEMLMMSGEYQDKAEAEQAIKDVKVGSLMSEQIAASRVPDGETFFVIKDGSGQILAKSILFDSRMVFDNALHAVKDSACIAEINDLS
jgi:uncharacterized protein YegP (UPF0339 family)